MSAKHFFSSHMLLFIYLYHLFFPIFLLPYFYTFIRPSFILHYFYTFIRSFIHSSLLLHIHSYYIIHALSNLHIHSYIIHIHHTTIYIYHIITHSYHIFILRYLYLCFPTLIIRYIHMYPRIRLFTVVHICISSLAILHKFSFYVRSRT